MGSRRARRRRWHLALAEWVILVALARWACPPPHPAFPWLVLAAAALAVTPLVVASIQRALHTVRQERDRHRKDPP